MPSEVKLRQLSDEIDKLPMPITKSDASSSLENVVLVLPDQKINLGDAVSELSSESFSSPDELELELLRHLAIQSVERYQKVEKGK
jgi:hypothetical protein